MHQVLPLLLEWLSDSPDPDLGLLGLRTLADGPQRATALVEPFRDSPEVARRLCTLLGTSRLLTTTLRQNPDLIPRLGDDRARSCTATATSLVGRARVRGVAGRTRGAPAGLHRFVRPRASPHRRR